MGRRDQPSYHGELRHRTVPYRARVRGKRELHLLVRAVVVQEDDGPAGIRILHGHDQELRCIGRATPVLDALPDDVVPGAAADEARKLPHHVIVVCFDVSRAGVHNDGAETGGTWRGESVIDFRHGLGN